MIAHIHNTNVRCLYTINKTRFMIGKCIFCFHVLLYPIGASNEYESQFVAGVVTTSAAVRCSYIANGNASLILFAFNLDGEDRVKRSESKRDNFMLCSFLLLCKSNFVVRVNKTIKHLSKFKS